MRNLVTQLVERTLRALQEEGALSLESMPRFSVDAPKKREHGDFAVNVAMMLAKPERKKPRDIAQLIVDNLKDDEGAVAKVEIAGPGFLNFTLSHKVVQGVVRQVLAAGDGFGRAAERSGKKVMVEFVSANPTGPLHLGHARGAFMGDAVSRLLDAAGHDVTREFYVNDAGNQIQTLGRTVHKRYRELHGEEVTLEAGEYPADYVIGIAQALNAADGDQWLGQEAEGECLARCTQIGIEENLNDIQKTLAELGISMDVWSSEQTMHDDGSVLAVVDHYRDQDAVYEATEARNRDDTRREDSNAAKYKEAQRGGTFLKTGEHGDAEDRIILRHDGTPVYLTADLAYHKAKYDRGFDRMIDVWGADHAGHVPRIRAGIELLGYDKSKFDFLLVQMVRLMRDGAEVKISKRAGEVHRLDEFVRETGPDAVRYVYLSRAATTQFDFDLHVLEKKDKTNPVFYLQYGHARCCSLLKRAEEQGKTFVGNDGLLDRQLEQLTLEAEHDILKKMAQLPDVVAGAAEALEPHRVIYYANELIADFHRYYTNYRKEAPIVSDDVDATQARLGMVAALKQTLKCAFGVLGISAPDHMDAPDDDEDDT
jgi:arginyl-tRNA synthetase